MLDNAALFQPTPKTHSQRISLVAYRATSGLPADWSAKAHWLALQMHTLAAWHCAWERRSESSHALHRAYAVTLPASRRISVQSWWKKNLLRCCSAAQSSWIKFTVAAVDMALPIVASLHLVVAQLVGDIKRKLSLNHSGICESQLSYDILAGVCGVYLPVTTEHC